MKRFGSLLFWLVWPLLRIWLLFSKRTRVLLVYKGRVLVVKSWLGDGKWQLPGGGLHRGEKPADGAVREVREELGIELESNSLVQIGEYKYSDSGLSFIYYAYSLVLSQEPTIRRRRWEISEAGFIDPAEVSVDTCGKDVLQVLNGWKH